ncbi:MAG TPA: leucine--tRNA ligase [Clostridiales bacterium]|nr:leucine--tRNA ligase [Clostridiales bacterium]
MDMKSIEQKWQKKWEKDKIYSFNRKNADKKFYCLEMFSYPSASKLHLGHWYNYGLTDSYARYKKMKGYEVFEPMGFDAFGLPAENYAIKTGIHPEKSTLSNIATMEKQLKAMGAMFDWNYEIKTCMPDYYKWTQWLFLKLYENGLAYRKEAPVNWCPSCNTVLANEQVQEGHCERCGTQVVKKNLTQWFFRITNYAEELLSGLNNLDWPEKTKAMQRNWIGKSLGGEVVFQTENGDEFKVFTTRADTLFGVSYVVLAPEHPLVKKLVTKDRKAEVNKYIEKTSKTEEIERLSTAREKTGVFIGAYAINPINGKKVPIYCADYVLYSYGTGAVMGVPAHDERDYVFAKKYGLPINVVIRDPSGKTDLPFCDDGTLINSLEFDGMPSEEARKAILNRLSTLSKGQHKINYRLRDWLVSRQRYWGAPIPVIHCEKCGAVPVPYKDLPVLLPKDVEFKPDGESPLKKCASFMNTKCPKCGGKAKRDPDTLDTFVCSSWYYLRYPDNKNEDMPFDPEIINRMLPVDKYVGGPEHACMHLLYARFITKALRDMGYLKFDEPFTSLTHQGIILGPDGNRISKSKGNVVSPDTYIDTYGSDILRLYLMFGFAYTEGGPWDDNEIKSIAKFADRIERLVEKVKTYKRGKLPEPEIPEKELLFSEAYAIKSVDRDMNAFSFNTAVARLMELVTAIYKYDGTENRREEYVVKTVETLITLLAPCAPHFSEELWSVMGNKKSVFLQEYPVCDESALVKQEVEIAVQVNSKMKGKTVVASDADDETVKAAALEIDSVKNAVAGKQIVKAIIVKGRLVNFIVK